MHVQACVLSKDMAFAQFVRLTLLTRLRQVVISEDVVSADIYVVDLDTVSLPASLTGKILCCSHTLDRPADFPYLWADRPFRPARLLALLDLAYEEEDDVMTLHPERHSCTLEGKEVSFSTKEFALLEALYEADGDYVSHDTLLARVWGEDVQGTSLLSVYIHYLRKKLEQNGKKYISSTRGGGYALILRKGDK